MFALEIAEVDTLLGTGCNSIVWAGALVPAKPQLFASCPFDDVRVYPRIKAAKACAVLPAATGRLHMAAPFCLDLDSIHQAEAI